MSIYIFTPSGSGGSQDLQSVLNVSSVLNQDNGINASNYNFAFSNVGEFEVNSSLVYLFHNQYIQFGNTSMSGMLQHIYDPAGYILSMFVGAADQNWLLIDPVANIFSVGDFFGTYLDPAYLTINNITKNTNLVSLNNVSIDTNEFQINEVTGGLGKITLNGTGYIATSAGGNSGKHLKITINSVNYKIALLNP